MRFSLSLAILAALFFAKPLPGIEPEKLPLGVNLRGASLGALAAKAGRGEEIRIATLGGSITQNAKGHSALIPDWFRAKYPGTEVRSFNLGLSSTCSHSGAFRLDRHVLGHAPDLLVAEFAVNDDQDARHSYEEAVRGIEGIVRRALGEDVPVFLILYVNQALLESVRKPGPAAASLRAHLAVAERYDLPTANVAEALAGAIKDGSMDWKDYGGVHPNSAGYAFATGLVSAGLEQLLRRPVPKKGKLPPALDSASYDDARWVHPRAAEREGKWTLAHPTREHLPDGGLRMNYADYPLLRSVTPGASLRLRFQGRAVGAFLLAGPDAGIVEVRIDGGEPREVDLYHNPYSRRLNYPRTRIFADGLKPGAHLLELSLSSKRNPASKGTACSLLYFAVNR